MKKNFFQKYKDILIPLILIVCAVFIIFQAVMPSLGSITELNRELRSEEKKLIDYKNSENVLASLNEQELLSRFETATSALPNTKDIQAIFLALNSAASESDLVLSGFSVQAGEVFEKNAKNKNIQGTPAVTVSIELSGVNENSILLFIKNLGGNFPLSKVTKMDLVNGAAELDIEFFYKPYDLNRINANVVLPLTEDEKKTLDNLSAY